MSGFHHSILTKLGKPASIEKKTPKTTRTLTNVNRPLIKRTCHKNPAWLPRPPPPCPLPLLPCDIHLRRRRRIRLQTHRLSRECIRLLRMSHRLLSQQNGGRLGVEGGRVESKICAHQHINYPSTQSPPPPTVSHSPRPHVGNKLRARRRFFFFGKFLRRSFWIFIAIVLTSS